MQLYREEGWYLERTFMDVSRVGLDYVKKKVLDDAANRSTCGSGCSLPSTATGPVVRVRQGAC